MVIFIDVICIFLTDWAKFLNKKSLLQQKRKDQSHKIASACFISTEPDGSTMIMPSKLSE